MICHLAIGMYNPIKPATNFVKHCQLFISISIIQVNISTPVSARGDVIECSLNIPIVVVGPLGDSNIVAGMLELTPIFCFDPNFY
jgi:hypothetical protein